MKIGIVIATYKKLDGSTYEQLHRALLSVKNQIHQDYKVFLIGDDYTDNDELILLSKIIDNDKIYVENLPIAIERSKYNSHILWTCGGTNATNIGIQKALDNEYNYLCLLDHDDYFLPNHLEIISKAIYETNTHFVATKCGNLPYVNIEGYYSRFRPIPEQMYKISACVDYKHYNFKIINVFEEQNRAFPGDADLWDRINKYMIEKNEYGYFVNLVTCAHPTEGTTMNFPNIVK